MKVSPAHISGSVTPPPSKSMMQRVCAAALLHRYTTTIINPGYSNDDLAALSITEQLGATPRENDDGSITITGTNIYPVTGQVLCGESGLSARLFTPIAALSAELVTITGEGSLLQRPMLEFGQFLPQLGVALTDYNGFLPLTLKGPLKPADIQLDGSSSSQYLTGLLFASAFAAQQPVTITAHDLQSQPYIDLTLQVLETFGKPIRNKGYREFIIDPKNFTVVGDVSIAIETDWSSAAAWVVAGAIGGNIVINRLNENSTQADKDILSVLVQCGVPHRWEDDALHIRSAQNLQPFFFDASHCPDLFPVLSILAACCDGSSKIKGLSRLTHKESNRADSIAEMLVRLGVHFRITDDSLEIAGKRVLNSTTIYSHNDHRIAMAAAIAASRTEHGITIEGAEAVSKSYPRFFDDLKSLQIGAAL